MTDVTDDSPTPGWQLVPRVLTPAMREAFWRNMTGDVEDGKASVADECWYAMLKAAMPATREGIKVTTSDSTTTDLATRYADQPPEGVNRLVWRGACALAVERHPNACWPQPQDVRDAMTVILAIGERKNGDV